ncbi:hypothetical protein CABS01_09742 [Colletotrichum abscissum]|uniref:Uncharacterized protein n=5 Tax=Colletotrichum acutatum species complex TaxID=2707335 RepID=A0A9P9XMX7_9PEZI|nr:uncharacterized protein CLUP02_18311 [Colletotrichum lupini]XP_060376596.1 uncharacterized protein CTAM01_12860 [Colletotrichum tamarilloi]XP_060399797.1 uncharacterized protein CABS01_09742 [Colletotrichum abscissum]KAI3538144.1 hypothetical protein CSPX01_09721 [Colletotrichum filicis]KAK0373404.1 hypothetical protein CLIM01_09242 [Colletotrichum limetticola]KAK1456658.1 hypothetical protein CMEL01_16336 [Colletotrichum melonis]KAI3556814.1 hypothetical protein CABS02_02821 [Colletotrich
MALWPFRRRSGRKRSRSGANLSDVEAPPTSSSQARRLTAVEATAPRAAMPKKQRLEKQQPAPRRERTYSFSPGRNDSIRVAGQKGSVPLGPGRSTGLFPADRNDGEEKGDPAWQRAPTLHNARHGQPSRSSRRKTSKRRREETDREAEIKAMANFAPVRPAADPWTSGRPIRKQSKRLKTGLGFRRSFENPQSDVSLPISIHSSMSSDTELHSFRVSALEALSPRPTLRYAVYPRWGPGHGSAPSRTQQQKRKVSERVPESVVRAHKRVDSFADDLDAADLRELMERDNRRRERKRQRDQERIERRLARRSEKQREAVAEARHSGSPPPVNLERGVLGRELGLGIDAASAVVTSSRRRSWSSSRQSRKISTTKDSEPEQEQTQEQEQEQEPQPETMDIEPEPAAIQHFHRTTSIPPEAPPSPTLPAQPAPERKTSTKLTPKASMRLKRSFLRRISRSRSPNATESDQHAISQYSSRQDEGEISRKDTRARISFSALFRLGKRNRRNSGPSSFSNTSRETMQASAAAAQIYSQSATHVPQQQEEAAAAPVQVPMPAIPPPVNYIPRKVSNGVPKRTRSRFREDLPELPLSPPDSRVGSPEVEMPLPVVSESKSGEISQQDTPAVRHDTPTSDLRRVDEKMEKLEKMRQTPTSLRHSIQPSPEPVSLASIDSEGSWLSGRVGARRSSGMRGSMQRLPPQNVSHSASPNDTEEELADDEYLSNLATPSREMLADEERTPRKSTGDAFPSSDEDEVMEDADMKWGSVDRQRATVVQHQRVKSREGMLKSYGEDGMSSPEGSEEGETPQLQRATSVSLSRGNARHVSAGSTKMLEVSPRSSVDHRRSTDAVF